LLTCKVGETIINCFDGKYDKHTLKKLDSEKRLVCPDCGKLYEYCHGQIVLPYFRHKEKNKECTGMYYEPETPEHINGKLILYKWLEKMQDKGLISNLKLEAYVPETRQRPDLYFESNGKRYVIEYQCSPIASQYLERHELYQLANINDIWILGFSNYNVSIMNDEFVRLSGRYKEIENHTGLYLNVDTNELCSDNSIIYKNLPYRKIELERYYKFKLDDCYFNEKQNYISLNLDLLKPYIDQDTFEYDKIQKLLAEKKEFENNIGEVINKLNNQYKHVNQNYYFEFIKSESEKYYLWKIVFYNKYDDLYFFIKEDKVDCCYQYNTTRSYCFRGKRGGLGWRKYDTVAYERIARLEYDSINITEIYNFIRNNVSLYLRNKKYKI
jgi:competence CoiA-like predicted nuclease